MTKKVQPLFSTQLQPTGETLASFRPISVQEMRETNITAAKYNPRVVQLLQSIHDPKMILSIGQEEMKAIAEQSDKALGQINDTKVDFITNQLSTIMKMVQHVEEDESNIPVIAWVKKKFIDTKENALAELNTTQEQMNRVVEQIEENTAHIHLKVQQLDEAYEQNIEYYNILTSLVNDVKTVLEIKTAEYDEMIANPNITQLEVELSHRLKQYINRLDKRLMTFEKLQFVAMQTAPSIRNIQDSGYLLLEKFELIRTFTIPMWKRTAKLYSDSTTIGKAADFADRLDDANNALMLANAHKQKDVAIKTAKLSQRDVIDTTTLVEVSKTLIDTFSEVIKINDLGQKARDESRRLIEEAKTAYLTTISTTKEVK